MLGFAALPSSRCDTRRRRHRGPAERGTEGPSAPGSAGARDLVDRGSAAAPPTPVCPACHAQRGTPIRAVRSIAARGRQGPALASAAARLLDPCGEQAPRERADELLLLAVSKAPACAGRRVPTTTRLSLAYEKRRSDGNDLTDGRESSGANRTTRAGMHKSATQWRTSASDFLRTAYAASRGARGGHS
jgi:hypothetical protein